MGLSVFEGPVVLESDQFGPIGPLRVKLSQKKTKNGTYSSSQLSYGEGFIEIGPIVSEHGLVC